MTQWSLTFTSSRNLLPRETCLVSLKFKETGHDSRAFDTTITGFDFTLFCVCCCTIFNFVLVVLLSPELLCVLYSYIDIDIGDTHVSNKSMV